MKENNYPKRKIVSRAHLGLFQKEWKIEYFFLYLFFLNKHKLLVMKEQVKRI